MSLVINHNLMAMKTERTLGATYSRLSTSIRRLSSGLRVVSAADDAAGLAVREQMRATIKTIDQGIRNALDGISAVRTAESSLGVIDTKLTRMKELAEQAATGTYTDDQRRIIHSEFSAVGSEIDRIASETSFNGVRLLDGNISIAGRTDATTNNGGWSDSNHWKSLESNWTNASGWEEVNGTVENENYVAGMAIHFGPGANRNEDYYFVRIGDMRSGSLFRGTGHSPETQVTAAETIAVSTQVAAQRALVQLDTAILREDNTRATLGSIQNRLEATVDSLSIEVENLQASESRISDIDVAKEMTELVRNQVLSQAGVSMLTQANAMPQTVLKIIG